MVLCRKEGTYRSLHQFNKKGAEVLNFLGYYGGHFSDYCLSKCYIMHWFKKVWFSCLGLNGLGYRSGK
jgi:TPP-dependent pyruvate/acetoin dehydrogenase alpha subunit